METGPDDYYTVVFDTEARLDALNIVREADDAAALLDASIRHFDERVLHLYSEDILAEFDEARLDERVASTEGFDPTLFKAVVLFELSHLETDEAIPALVKNMHDFWQGIDAQRTENWQRFFIAETKRSDYRPFSALSEFVTLSYIRVAYDWEEPLPDEEQDPFAEAIDGKPQRVFLGSCEISSPSEEGVLSERLIQDLYHLYPRKIVQELKFRFPEDATFAEIQPLIDKIQSERCDGDLPPIEEILPKYQQLAEKYPRLRPQINTEAEWRFAALDYIDNFFRSIEARTIPQEFYVPELGEWFSIKHVESDSKQGAFYQRIFRGDLAARSDDEVPIEERGPIINVWQKNREAVYEHLRPWQKNITIHDVIGSYYA